MRTGTRTDSPRVTVRVALRVVCILAMAGCKPESGKGRGAAIVISGDTQGWITPCGCTFNQSGGLPRRASYIQQAARGEQVVYVDAGGTAGGNSEYQRLKFEAILRGQMQMGLAAQNLGGPELALGAAYLREVGARLSVPFVSCNARDEQGNLLAEPMRIVTAGNRRIAVVGVVSTKFAQRGLRIDEPRASLLAAIGEAKGKHDSLVVLAYLPEDELTELAAGLPEADAVIGGPTGQSIAPRMVGPTLLASATNKGKFIVHLSEGVAARWSGKAVELDKIWPDDPGQNRNVAQFLSDLGRLDIPAGRSGLAAASPQTPAEVQVAGSPACETCHPSEHASWKSSGHARAWEDLHKRGSHVDPYCQQCHATGYGLPGGFDSIAKSANLVDVGCESCHGPSGAHVRRPKVRTSYLASGQCLRCHDHENSPGFEYGAYWKKILHGEKASTRPATSASEVRR